MSGQGGLAASFRDPSGHLFERGGALYRRVNAVYAPHYEKLIASGLYEELTRERLLIPHEEVDPAAAGEPDAYKVLRPERVPFISYPYEWCFGQLQDAALATLEIQRRAFEKGLVLKDASAYNIQFHKGRPTLIDTLSFEAYEEGRPWIAYGQFCRHFLAPLALTAEIDARLGRLLALHIDGVPLDLASALLRGRARWSFGLQAHIRLHARAQRRYADRADESLKRGRAARVSPLALRGLIDSLRSACAKLRWRPEGTEWGDYYGATNYDDEGMRHKAELVEAFLAKVPGPIASVWDLGANTGLFSRIASRKGIPTVAFDADPAAVEKNYRQVREKGEAALLPLVLDLTNPSPGLGWAHRERDAFADRGPADAALALALVHHLAISNNVPLPRLAEFLRGIVRKALILEFVPKEDSQVRRLLATREDVFPDYRREGFEAAVGAFFEVREAAPVRGGVRTLYLLIPR